MKLFKDLGPGVLVAAAFIGPGTVTICTIAGAKYQFVLLWTMLFSVAATIVLQEMSARLGIVAQKGLAQAVKDELPHPIAKFFAVFLMISAIFIGNAAYEAGNISGGILGLETLWQQNNINISDLSINLYSVFIGFIAFVVLWIGSYKVIEKALVSLVILMSLAFVLTALITTPNLVEIIKGLFIPSFPEGSLFVIIGLIGTTVVPYNLFLHASLVQEKWSDKNDINKARRDTVISIIGGGVVSLSIMISAAAINSSDINNAADLALGLEPLFGSYAKYLLAIGLFAAGITSAITAPMAAAFVASGCFNWQSSLTSTKFRITWFIVLSLGVIFSSIGFKSIEVIKFAQVANGILLPLIALFLIWIMNKKPILGPYTNSTIQNISGIVILLLTFGLAIKSLGKVFNLF